MNQEQNVRWFLEPLKKYSQFSGRARRKEFWQFTLFSTGITFVLAFCEGMFGLSTNTQVSVLAGIYSLAVLVPSIAVSVRRLHDTNRSGWWSMIGMIPLVGSIVLLVYMAADGTSGSNRFGPNPKAPPPGIAPAGTAPPATRPLRAA